MRSRWVSIRAEESFKRAVTVAEQTGRVESLAANLTNLGNVYRMQARYSEAVPLYVKALATANTGEVKDPMLLATILRAYGQCEEAVGHAEQADELLTRSRRKMEMAGDTSSESYALTLNSLAELYASRGQLKEAQELYARVLAISRKELGKSNSEYGMQLQGSADLARRQGRFVEAETQFDEAINVLKRAGFAKRPEMATALNNKAVLYMAENDLDRAEPLLVEARPYGVSRMVQRIPSTRPRWRTSARSISGRRITGRRSLCTKRRFASTRQVSAKRTPPSPPI